MHDPGGDVASVAYTISVRRTALGYRHFSFEDDMRGLGDMRVVRIVRVRSVLPHIRVEKSFVM